MNDGKVSYYTRFIFGGARKMVMLYNFSPASIFWSALDAILLLLGIILLYCLCSNCDATPIRPTSIVHLQCYQVTDKPQAIKIHMFAWHCTFFYNRGMSLC
ncbi:hypothetical protein Dimus_016735 [Dionaea muscipula]